MKYKRFSRKNLAFNIISAVVLLILVFSILVSLIGYATFTDSMNEGYGSKATEVAYTAATLINPNHIQQYLEKGTGDNEWQRSSKNLQTLCDKMEVTKIYIVCVDNADYENYVTVFHVVNSAETSEAPLETGRRSVVTTDDYKTVFREIYTDEVESADFYGAPELRGDKPSITSIIPVKDNADNVTALICVQLPMTNLHDRMNYILNVAISAIVLIVLFVIIYSRYIRRQFVNPLRKVSAETNRFAKENKKGGSLGKVSRINEIAGLGHDIEQMETDMLKYIENLTSVTAERERVRAELSIAADIQKNAVPNEFPAFPERKDFDIFASMTPAKEVGGDFYNFFLLDDDHLAIVMADVSDKGIPAALFMMVANYLISDRAKSGGTPAEILEYVNSSLCSNNKADLFVTVWFGILEISTGKLTAANAGHNDPALYRKGGQFEVIKNVHGIAIGVFSDAPYNNFEIQLYKGDKIFLYTDGLTDATNADDKMLKISGMLKVLNTYKEENVQGILDGVNRYVSDFAGDAPQSDDLTMLCLELK